MLTYHLNPDSRFALYEQLYTFIRNDIESGVLTTGERLPSKRALSENLGVSSITVENAYQQLISEGYVHSLPKKGYYISNISEISRMKPENTSAGIQLPAQEPDYPMNLTNNQTAPENFPFSIWSRLLRETVSEKKAELMTNAPCNGIRALREAISGHLLSFRGMTVDPDQIFIGAGTEYLYGLLIQLLGREKIYCLENPGHKKIAQIYQSNQVELRWAELDSSGLSDSALKDSGADIAHISPTHHFPTGITMPVSRRYELLAWANEREGRYIIEDDYDSEFRLRGKPIPSLQSIDVSEKVIYMNTFSKSLASTIRISYMVLPVHLANRFYRGLAFYACTVSNFEQYTLARFIQDGYFEKHINRMRLYYARARKAVLSSIQKSGLNKHCEIIERDSGLHFLLKLNTELPDSVLAERFKQRGIYLLPLSGYSQTPSDAHIFILNYSNLDLASMDAALDGIMTCLRR